jgi:DNA invertase Pin-like site-specific DNA recombinase
MKKNLKIRWWVRATQRNPEKVQVAAGEAVRAGTFYIAGKDSLADVLFATRAGDVIGMTTPSRISSVRKDHAAFFQAVHKKGAYLWATVPNIKTDTPQGAAAFMALAADELATDARALTSEQARKNQLLAAESLRKKHRTLKTSDAVAKSVWYDRKIAPNSEKLSRPEMRGWTEKTAYKRLGPTK